MPADRAAHNHRRTSADDSKRQREQELRRARGEIACVECQRLKLKCDRQVPCSSCLRRGRAAMCPNGHAWSDQETRVLLSNTAQLHRKLSEMSQRIRQLEDALEISHAANSSHNHPLLREELLSIKRGVAMAPTPAAQEGEADAPEGDYVEAMGTMSISERGISRFIGRTGGGESLFLLGSDLEQAHTKSAQDPLFSPFISRRSDAWLFMAPNSSQADVLAKIEANMPTYLRASSLCETHLENFCWIQNVVDRQQMTEELLPSFYVQGGSARLTCKAERGLDSASAHELALLLMIFSTGALADLTLPPPPNDEAERYYQMALAALSLTPVIGAATLPAVQAVSLMAVYNAHCARNNTLDLAGSLFNLAANLGVSMGLHRDVERWNVCSASADRRRVVFWELFTSDAWHNIANGKPTSFNLRYCDCKLPEKNAEIITKDGKKETSYWAYRNNFSKLVFAVSDLFSGVKPVRYSQILELDQKLSEIVPPAHLKVPPEGSSMEADGPLLIMQRMIPVICGDGLLMHMHRGPFAKALLENPMDPLLSKYSRSYLTAHKSALAMLKCIREHYAAFPNLVSRFWSLWSHAFSATVIIASIATKGRNPDTVRTALNDLNLAVQLFEKAAKDSNRAKRSLPTLLRLQEKAQNAARALNGPTPNGLQDESVVKTEENTEDELLIFAGKNRLVKEEPREDSLPPPSTDDSSCASLYLPNASSSNISYDLGLNSRERIFGSNLSRSSSHDQHRQSLLSSHHLNSPSDATAPTLPSTPDDSLLMNTDLPGAWSAWSDQEALLINYISSGADMHLAQNAAFRQEPDPASFMWQGMGNTNGSQTPEEPTSPDGTKIPNQHLSTGPPLSSSSGANAFRPAFPTFGGGVDSQRASFVNAPESGLGLPQGMVQGQQGMAWDMFF